MSHVVFIFVDGIGIAPASDHNPFVHANMPTLRRLLGGALTSERGTVRKPDCALVPLDATLGVTGLPQSGTGQATLMTGENCAVIHGAHFGPYPPSKVRPIVNAQNLFSQCVAHGMSVDFVNAFPQRYFDYLAEHPLLKATIASSFEASGHALHTADDLIAGNAISADIIGERWNEIGHAGVPSITLDEAGKRLASISRQQAFTMFEYWLTDKAGHKQDMAAACSTLERLDGMIGGLLDSYDANQTLIAITSDHGNMEDLSVPTHTLNPVPLIVFGSGADEFAHGATSLLDIAPRIFSSLIAS